MANSIHVSFQECNNTVTKLLGEVSTNSLVNVTKYDLDNLQYFCAKGHESRENDKFSEPLVWIGVYIAAASFICILGVLADFLRGGMWKDRYQIPSKYFSLNVTSMTLITIAMKLPVDLSGSMPGNLDQVAKIGSIAFMCTVLAILNPSLASMDNRTLLANIVGLAIFVVTIAVNLFIEIGTGVIKNKGPLHLFTDDEQAAETWKVEQIYYSFKFVGMISTYIGIMILLLLISISTAIISPSFKKTLEFKYQVRRQALDDDRKQQHSTRIPTVEELTQYVTRFWIMAKTGSPQFVMARNLLSYASLYLCTGGMIIYAMVLISLHKRNAINGNYESDYKWSIPVILIVQFIGNVMGTLLVICRCIGSMRFIEDTWTDMFNLRKEKYWTEKLCEWKGSPIGFLSGYPRLRKLVHPMKKCVLSFCIGLQKAFVVLICQLFMFFCICYLGLTRMLYDALVSTTPVVSRNDDDIDHRDLRDYVLQLDDEAQPSQKVVENISNSMNRLIERAKKKQNNNLLELLGKYSNGFKGVESFDDGDQKFSFDDLPDSVKLINSWSVPVITLSSIAIAVPGISKDQVDSLIKSIDKALLYTHPVEESFNSAHEYVNIRKTSMTLWYEVRDKPRRWLENPIGEGACGQLPRNILTWFSATAEAILRETKTREHMINFPSKFVAAHSMHRISNSILSKYQDETKELFFESLCSMIADILVACFSNLPQVIKMKCHADEIEKREASVEAAVKLFGRSTEIIRKLEACTLPNMDPEKMGSIHEWRLHLKQSNHLPSSIKS